MSALAIIFSPTAEVETARAGDVTFLVVTYEPPLRSVRRAPASLRPAPLTPPEVTDLSRLIGRLPVSDR